MSLSEFIELFPTLFIHYNYFVQFLYVTFDLVIIFKILNVKILLYEVLTCIITMFLLYFLQKF